MTSMKEFVRDQGRVLAARLAEPRRFIQVVAGPRQVGKTTLVRQVLAAAALPSRSASADEPTLRDAGWVEGQWQALRPAARASTKPAARRFMVLPEVQVPHQVNHHNGIRARAVPDPGRPRLVCLETRRAASRQRTPGNGSQDIRLADTAP